MHENGNSTPWKNHIRTARKITAMKTVSETTSVRRPSDPKFSGRILAPYSGHEPGASIWRQAIRQLVHSAAIARARPCPSFDLTAAKIARAMIGDTLFPIIRKECQTVG